MRGLVGIVGLVAVTIASCDRPIPVALNAPSPMPYPPQYAYPPSLPQYGAPPQTPSATLYLPTPHQATVADDKGELAATIQLDTVQFNADGRGSATVCHKSEQGQSCNLWTFNCNYLPEFAHSNYFPVFMQRPNGPPLTPKQNAELDNLHAVAAKLPTAACRPH